MEARELRIGNYFIDQFGNILTIDGIEENDVFSKATGEIPLHVCLPIPLSEDWLVKFGFFLFL